MLHFVTSYMKQNQSRKQSLENVQNGLEIILNRIGMEIAQLVFIIIMISIIIIIIYSFIYLFIHLLI